MMNIKIVQVMIISCLPLFAGLSAASLAVDAGFRLDIVPAPVIDVTHQNVPAGKPATSGDIQQGKLIAYEIDGKHDGK